MYKTKDASDRSVDRNIVKLGKAKDLTRAEIQGTKAELVGERLYSPGG